MTPRSMERVATRRLVDASASLGAADSALLNLWINRGLDDAALGRLTGVETGSIAGRRERIVTHLSKELGLPPGDVKEALEQIAESTAQPMPGLDFASSNGGPEAAAPTPAVDESAPSAVPTAGLNGHAAGDRAIDQSGVTEDEPTADTRLDAGSRPRRGLLLALLGLLAVAVGAAVLVIALSSGSGKQRLIRTASTTAAHSTTVPAVPVPPTSASPAPTVSRPPVHPLAALPGGVAHAGGSVFLIRRGHRQRQRLMLRLTVRGLPAAHAGHYQVWLYNSILDSVALARLRTGVHKFVLRLPRHARHYHWIDISFQPRGFINHSGESVVRAANPARATRKQLRKRSARRRELRRTTGASARTKKHQ